MGTEVEEGRAGTPEVLFLLNEKRLKSFLMFRCFSVDGDATNSCRLFTNEVGFMWT